MGCEKMVRLDRELKKIHLSSKQLGEMTAHAKAQTDVLALYLYGSYGTPLQTELSDVDVAVLSMPTHRMDLMREVEVLSELSYIGKSDDINLINLRGVPVTLQMQVLDTGRTLYVRDEVLLADFREEVIRRYCDFEPHLRRLYQDFDAGLREEFL